MAPLISVVMPAHNAERLLRRSLGSLLAQSWRPLEILVMSDASTDRTEEIGAAFGPPVRVIPCDFRHPIPTRNLGITQAQGEFIAFLDHDDFSPPDRFALQMAAFQEDPELDVCVGMVQRVRWAGGEAPFVPKADPVPGYLTITMLARRQTFDRVGLLNPSQLHADSAEWFLRARALDMKVRLLPQVLTLHVDHEENRSVTHGERSRKEFLRLIKAKLDRERQGE
ncbi:glycosyltransferase family 2 protein [Ancylobacter sp.]|uniref:glycosyltransferase family 2 protein n=1 Tax=Ancylobacter sp. TaxID=1872567 RepID=UPI003D0F94A3